MSVFLSQQPLNNADFIIPVEIEGIVHQVGTLIVLCGFNATVTVITEQSEPKIT